MATYSEGVCGNGAAVLRDGEMVPIEQVIVLLNAGEELQKIKSTVERFEGLLSIPAKPDTSIQLRLIEILWRVGNIQFALREAAKLAAI